MTTTGIGLARVAGTDRPPSLAGTLETSTPEAVGRDLARALASGLCRGLGHRAGAGASCGDCLAAGRALAPPVGRALFACRRGERPGTGGQRGSLAVTDYEVVGRGLELLEELAGNATRERRVTAGHSTSET